MGPLAQEWAAPESGELSLYDLVTEMVKGYGLTPDVDPAFKTEPIFRVRPNEAGESPEIVTQTNQSDWQFLQQLAYQFHAAIFEDGTTVKFWREETLLERPPQDELSFVYHTPNPRVGVIHYVNPDTFDPRKPTAMPILSVSGDIDILQASAKGAANIKINASGDVELEVHAREHTSRSGTNYRVLMRADADAIARRIEEYGSLEGVYKPAVGAVFGSEEGQAIIDSLLIFDYGGRTQRSSTGENPLIIKPNWKLNITTLGTLSAFPGRTYKIHNLADFLEGGNWLCTRVQHTFAGGFKTTVTIGWVGQEEAAIEEVV
jgi:hypothetical protein